MRKRNIPSTQDSTTPDGDDWLDLDALAEVEITSEDPAHPIEAALSPSPALGWRAAGPGEQTIRILFPEPQHLRRIWLEFTHGDALADTAIADQHDLAGQACLVGVGWQFSRWVLALCQTAGEGGVTAEPGLKRGDGGEDQRVAGDGNQRAGQNQAVPFRR